MIQLNTLLFWFVCGAGVLAMAPLRSRPLRNAVMAAVNVFFLIMLLRWSALGVIVAIAAVHLILRYAGSRRRGLVVISVLGATVATLFLIHKLPVVAANLSLDPLSRVLGLIGYSYVALRMIELLRAVFEQRHPPPAITSTINYLLPFHMLAAGPIQSYDDFVQQTGADIDPDARTILRGMERIAAGLFKKFVIAYAIQTVFLTNFEAGGMYRLVEIQLFFVWLFVDFSAYSDIAVGVGMLLGVATPENFNRPLLARNVIDFWERWHISLSLFIRRNIFIPLQMFFMRRTEGRMPLLSAAIAIVIAFALCGLWHGLTVGFLIWGLAQAVGLIVVRLYAQTLQARLGKARFKQYLASKWWRVAATVVTFEFEAVVLVALFKA
jgi:D-alanyl-lipoteichoic acid acyltransferase DltB (MBOAT superfamily)